MNRLRSLALILILACLSGGGFLWASYRTHGLGFPLDDAWIHQTYARNLAERGEWAFLPGQPSAGSTGPLWTAALALGRILGIEAHAWSYALGIAILAFTGWACGRWLSQRHSAGSIWVLTAGVLVVFEWHLVWAAVSGMETLALGLVVVLVLWWLESPGRASFALGALVGFGVWLRPDALSLLVPVGIRVLGTAREGFREAAGRLLAVGLGVATVLAPYLAFNQTLSGEWWPSTFYAKQAEYAVLRQLPLLTRVGEQWRAPLVGAGAVLAAGIIVSAWKAIGDRSWTRLAPLIWAVIYLGIYALRLPVTYQHGRYAMPTIPVLLVSGMDGLVGWIQLRAPNVSRRLLSRAWVISLAIVTMTFWFLGCRAYAEDVAIIETEMVTAARWISNHTDPESLVAAHDIGALGYFGDRPLLDLAGLVSPEVIPILRDESALASFLDANHADYLMTFPGWYPELTGRLERVFTTGGGFSPLAGGENMTVYRWRLQSFARQAVPMLYSEQSH